MKCSWYLLLNSQNPTSIFRPKVTEPTGIKNYKATHTCKKCEMLPTSNTVHRERNTKHTTKPLYSGFSRYHSENTFSLFFPPLILCLFVGLRVFEGVWHFRNRSCLLGISVGKLRKRSVSVHAPQISFSSWHRERFLAPFKKPPGTASYLATLCLHQLESILLIFPCLEASQQWNQTSCRNTDMKTSNWHPRMPATSARMPEWYRISVNLLSKNLFSKSII